MKRVVFLMGSLFFVFACDADSPGTSGYFDDLQGVPRSTGGATGAAPSEPGGTSGMGGAEDGSTPSTLPEGSAPEAGVDAAATADASVAPSSGDAVERGRYLVHHVAACTECHTPRTQLGALDETRLLSGVECFRDASPDDDSTGCLNTGNLTAHVTGLANRSDAEIKRMFLEGVRPNGQPLHATMPYWAFANMQAADADAIVAYLRTVPAVEHMIPPNQSPFDAVTSPEPRWPEAELPSPRPDYADPQAAARGRYLASNVGACIECHTPKAQGDSPDRARAYRGGLEFQRASLGLPGVFFPDVIRTANLTPHADGLMGWSVDDVVSALKEGVDREGDTLCPPMPGGMGAFGGLTDADAADIAHYLLSLEPGEGAVVDECAAPF